MGLLEGISKFAMLNEIESLSRSLDLALFSQKIAKFIKNKEQKK